MTLRSFALTLLSGSLCASLFSCDFTGGGGGGGSGGGTGTFSFTRGYAFALKDTRNLAVADSSDYQTSQPVTTTGGAHTPALSKDGKYVAFSRGTGATAELDVVAVTGGTVSTVLAADDLKTNLRTPAFSPDGTHLAFAYDENGSSSVGVVNVDGSGFTKIIGGGALAYASPSYFADGASLLVAAGNAGLSLTQVESVKLGTAVETPVTNTLGNEAQRISGRLLVSPDGANAVFDAQVSSGVTRVYLLNLTTKVVTKLNDYTSDPTANDSFPTWKSASTVAYGSDSGGNDNVYTITITGTGRTLELPTAIEPFFGPVP
jgi:TolB protein